MTGWVWIAGSRSWGSRFILVPLLVWPLASILMIMILDPVVGWDSSPAAAIPRVSQLTRYSFWQMFCLHELRSLDQWPLEMWGSILRNLHSETGCHFPISLVSSLFPPYPTPPECCTWLLYPRKIREGEEVMDVHLGCHLPNPLTIFRPCSAELSSTEKFKLHSSSRRARMLPPSSDCFLTLSMVCYENIVFLNLYVVSIIVWFHGLALVLLTYISAFFWRETLSPKSCLKIILQIFL